MANSFADDAYSVRLHWSRFFLAGCAWAIFYTFMLEEVFAISWRVAILESLSTNALLVTSMAISLFLMRYYSPARDRLLYILTVASFGSVLIILSERALMTYVLGMGEHLISIEKSFFFHGGFAFLANAAALGLSLQRNTEREKAEVKRRHDEADRIAKEAELLTLRHQLQPHFLFNSLNSINALIIAEPTHARQMVQQLSAFLRGTMKQNEWQPILLSEELKHIELYLEIEKVRFGHRLHTEIHVDDEAMNLFIPPLLLQPLMENAIKFGLYGTIGDVCIVLKARFIPSNTQMDAASANAPGVSKNTASGMLHITLSNPVDSDVETQRGTGFGLNSIQRRLHLIYGRNDLLTTDKSEELFTVELRIPQST